MGNDEKKKEGNPVLGLQNMEREMGLVELGIVGDGCREKYKGRGM